MGIRINFGVSKKKNTSVCIDEINAALSHYINDEVIVLVPEQFSSYYEQLLVNRSMEKGSFRAEILTFKRLAYRVFTRNFFNSSNYLDNAGKSMLMYESVSDQSDNFEAFAKAGKFPTFANEALKTIREFKRYRVTPEILLEIAPKANSNLLTKKIQEMAEVYKKYEEKLEEQGFCDADDNLANLALLINKSNEFRNTHIWVDGFDGFTPTEMDVIESLMNKAHNVVFSFCCKDLSLPGISDVFYPVVKNIIKVQKAAERLNFKIKEKLIKADFSFGNGLPGEIEHLARNYFQFPGKTYYGSVEHIKLYKADSIYEEVERCALEISRKVRNGSLRYGDISVVSGLYDQYKEYIDAIFNKYNIPVFMDEKRSIAKHPVSTFILAVLDVYNSKYSYEAVCEYLKSPYSDISIDEMTMIENYILQWDIKGIGMWTHGDWDFYTNLPDNEVKLRELNRIREKITSVFNPLFNKLRYGIRADEFITAIFNFILSQGIFKKIQKDAAEAETDGRLDYADELKQSWNILMDIFNQIHLISQEGRNTVEKYRIFLDLALTQKKIGVIPPRTDAVFAGKLNKAYGNRVKMLMILGANDPGFPEKIVNEGLLTDKDRADILAAGLELAPDTKTQVMNSLIDTYNLLNLPDTFLYVSYATSGMDGSVRQRSNFFNRMDDLFETHFIEDSSKVNPDEYIINPVLGLDALSCRGDRSAANDGDRSASHDGDRSALGRWYSENSLPTVTGVPKEVIPQIEFSSIIRNLLGNAIESSPTVIEKYVSCPYKYFAGNALNAVPRKTYQISAPDVGSILHGILKDLVEKHISDEHENEAEYLEDAHMSLSNMKLAKIFKRDHRHGFLGDRLVQRAVDSFKILKRQVNAGEFKPIQLEAAFGRNKEIAAPRFSSAGHSMYLNGRIDRVDGALVGDEEFFRIIDYKSSDRGLSLYKINEGLDIQLASYMMAYEMHSGTNPAGMYYFTTDKKLMNVNYGDTPEDVTNSRAKESCMEGYTLNDRDVIIAMDSHIAEGGSVIPVKYNQKKDEFSKKVLDAGTIAAMTERVGQIVMENTDKIYNCEFPVKPVRAEITACTYCDYNDICGFNNKKPGCEYRIVHRVSDKDVVWGKNE